MNPDDWARTQELFEAALMREPTDREAFLDQACADHPEIRAEVASLLAAHDRSADFIERPAYEAAADVLVSGDPGERLDGRLLGPYIIRHEIGRGAMGIVYLADDSRLSRRVALKALAPGTVRDDRRRERLRQEARAAAALSHPGIATVYALEEIDDELYLACEYVPGRTLRALIDSGPVPLPEVLDIATQLARALAAAHGQGVVHRDLKPENVVRTTAGVAKILDFGVARTENLASTRLTESGAVLGTPGYMAPEQIRGQDSDFRTDLFSFGLLIYEIASGSNPFQAATPTATFARILEFDPPPLTEVGQTRVTKLDRIVATCLHKHPSERYRSTRELVADLERLQEEMSSQFIAPTVRLPSSRAASTSADASAGFRRSVGEGESTDDSDVLTPRWWWGFHQLAVSSVYVLMMYPVWRVRSWLPPPWGMLFLLAVLVCAAAATTLRLHLWFTARFYPAELAIERARAQLWTRWCDVGLTASLLLAAFSIGSAHPEIAMLLVTVAVAAGVASLIIEPTTARAAFGDPSG